GSLTGKLQQVELSIRDDGARRRRDGFETPVPDTGYSIPYRLLILVLLAMAALLLIAIPIVKAAWGGRGGRGARRAPGGTARSVDGNGPLLRRASRSPDDRRHPGRVFGTLDLRGRGARCPPPRPDGH